MHRVLFIIFLIFTFQSFANSEQHTDPTEFYDDLKKLALNNEVDVLSGMIKYPVFTASNLKVRNAEEFKKNYNEIFTSKFIEMLSCYSVSEDNKVGWRGYMISNGALWFDRNYFGKIVPNKESDDYFQQIDNQLDDTKNWWFRVTSIDHEIIECPQ